MTTTTSLPANIKVGPGDDGSYYYRVDGRLSWHRYHNSASAVHDALRPQKILDNDRIEPLA